MKLRQPATLTAGTVITGAKTADVAVNGVLLHQCYMMVRLLRMFPSGYHAADGMATNTVTATTLALPSYVRQTLS